MLALADRIDTLVSLFSIGKIPTGDKDPFALRRAALGIIRMIIEKELTLDLHEIFDALLDDKSVVNQIISFVGDRLKAWYLEQDIAIDTLRAVF